MTGRPRLTTFHLFRVPPQRVPTALTRMAADRRPLRQTPGLLFWKLLGTGNARTFDVRDADPRTWALVAVWAHPGALAAFEQTSPVAAAWRRLSVLRWRVDLALVGARGRWSGRTPFGDPHPTGAGGPVAAITRARLRPGRARTFWRAVPPVTADLRQHTGLRFAVGIGEAPLGVQGTFSLWQDVSALRAFAYEGQPHRTAMRRSSDEHWYAEELFARFAVLQTTGALPADGAAD